MPHVMRSAARPSAKGGGSKGKGRPSIVPRGKGGRVAFVDENMAVDAEQVLELMDAGGNVVEYHGKIDDEEGELPPNTIVEEVAAVGEEEADAEAGASAAPEVED